MTDDNNKVRIRVLEIEGDPESLRQVLGVGVFAPVPLELEAGDPDDQGDGDPDHEDEEAENEPEQPQPVLDGLNGKERRAAKPVDNRRRSGWCTDCGDHAQTEKHKEHLLRIGQLCPGCRTKKESMTHHRKCVLKESESAKPSGSNE